MSPEQRESLQESLLVRYLGRPVTPVQRPFESPAMTLHNQLLIEECRVGLKQKRRATGVRRRRRQT